jgi:MFS family permease
MPRLQAGFVTTGHRRQHPRHGRLDLDHEEVLQDPALPLVAADHLRAERDPCFRGEAGDVGVGLAFVLYFLINFIVDLQGPVFWSIISEAVDYGELKSGKRVAGMAFGGISFAQKMGMSLAAGMVGWLLTYFKYEADVVQSAFTLNGIALLLTVIPGFFHLGMGLLMYRYRITDRYYNNIKEQLAAQGKLVIAGAGDAKSGLRNPAMANVLQPLILQRADPCIRRHADGWYYFHRLGARL